MAHAEHIPGEPPSVIDEAADTPMWVPALGLALLLLAAIGLIWQSSTSEEEAAAEAETEQVDEEGAEGEAVEAEADADADE